MIRLITPTAVKIHYGNFNLADEDISKLSENLILVEVTVSLRLAEVWHVHI